MLTSRHLIDVHEGDSGWDLFLTTPDMLANVLNFLLGDRLQQVVLRPSPDALENCFCVLVCRHHCRLYMEGQLHSQGSEKS